MTFKSAKFTIRHRKGIAPAVQTAREVLEESVVAVMMTSKAESSLYKGLHSYRIKAAGDPFPNWTIAYSDELEFM